MVHPSGACKKYGPRLRAQVSGDSGRVPLGTLIPFRRVLHSHSLGRLAWQIDWEAKPCRENGRTTKRKQVLPCCIRSTPMGGSGHGATEIYIAVPADRDPQPVRHVSTFTEDLHAAAAWLKACPIETVAMESTGVYWIPFFQILEARGFQVLLVKHTSCEECARTQVRCFRLSMAAVSSLGGFAQRIVPSSPGSLHRTCDPPTSEQSGANGFRSRATQARGARSDERAMCAT